MFKSKYLVMQIAGAEQPFLFSELMNHVDVAERLRGNVVGAGFCYIMDNRYVCYGESISCRVKSRGEEDSRILNRLLGTEEF